MRKAGGSICWKTKTSRTTRRSSAFTDLSCSGRPENLTVVTEKIHELPPVVILRLRNMTALDATGLFALEEVAKELHAAGRTLILCGAREQPAQLIHQAEFEDIIGRENICESVQAAFRLAKCVFEKLEANTALGRK